MNQLQIKQQQLPVSSLSESMEFAKMISTSDVIPAAYQNKPANVWLVLELAKKINIDPLTALSNMDVIRGKVSPSSKFLISLANRELDEPISFEEFGDINSINKQNCDYAVRATAKLKNGKSVQYHLEYKTCVAEGWTTKAGNKYSSLPFLMMCYRAATFLCRLYLPHLSMLLTKEENEDIIDVTPRQESQAPKNNNIVDIKAVQSKVSQKNEDIEKMFDINNQFNEKRNFFVEEIERNIAVFCTDMGLTDSDVLYFKNEVLNTFKENYIKTGGKYDLDNHFQDCMIAKRIQFLVNELRKTSQVEHTHAEIAKLKSSVFLKAKANPGAKIEEIFESERVLTLSPF